MTRRIFRAIFLAALAVLLACTVLIMSVLYDYFSDLRLRQLRVETELAAAAVEVAGEAYLEAVNAERFRVTWIDPDGAVRYDTDADAGQLGNHLDREEVRLALVSGYGESERYSDTMTTKMLYAAKRLDDGSVLRVSSEQYSLFTFILLTLQPLAAVLIAAAILSGVLASRLSRRIVRPLNELDLDHPLANDAYPELAPLLGRIEQQHRQIDAQLEELQARKDEFEAVTGSMSEGLALLAADGAILSINRAAARLLGAGPDAVGRDILTVDRSLPLQAVLQKAREGSHAEDVLPEGERVYRLAASPVCSGGAVTGVVLLIFDATEKERAEQLRREFTANVSHELKTPLHSISGCAEIIKNGLVKPEDQPRFIGQIYAEAQRLIALVDDIIGLSRLDEGAGADLPREPVDLLAAAESAASRLASAAAARGIQISCEGEALTVPAVPSLVDEILYDLCDNAVKYNVDGGSVVLSVAREGAGAAVSVRDTGVGIAPEHQSRVFERFYRVDKSRSKAIGGTGLGLSIVKHAAQTLGASLTLESRPGRGSTFTICFPTVIS